MAQFRFKPDDTDEVRQETKNSMRAERKTSSPVSDFMSFFVRLMGILMLLVGLWMGVTVIKEVWGLYRGPHHIERFADAIDKGSNLDKVLASFSSKRPTRRVKEREGLVEEAEVAEKKDESLRVSYFLAWIIVIFLLMLIGRLALSAIKTGGELALYDLQVKRFARLLIEEVRDPDKKNKI